MRPADLGRPDVAMPGSDIAKPAVRCTRRPPAFGTANTGSKRAAVGGSFDVAQNLGIQYRCAVPAPRPCPWLVPAAASGSVTSGFEGWPDPRESGDSVLRRRRPRWVGPSHRTRSYRYQVISFRFQCPPGEALIGSKGCCPGRLSKIVSTRTSAPYFAVFHGPSEQSGCPPTYDLLIS